MTEYERKWLSFIEETKATDTGILNEYVSDIINTAKAIADRAKGQGSDSPLSGLGRAGTPLTAPERKEIEAQVASVADLEGTNPQILATLKPGEQLQTQEDLGEFIMILFELLCGVRNANEGVKEEAREEIKKSLEEAKGIEDLRKIFESVIEALIAQGGPASDCKMIDNAPLAITQNSE